MIYDNCKVSFGDGEFIIGSVETVPVVDLHDVEGIDPGTHLTTVEFSFVADPESFANLLGPFDNPRTERDLEGSWLWP